MVTSPWLFTDSRLDELLRMQVFMGFHGSKPIIGGTTRESLAHHMHGTLERVSSDAMNFGISTGRIVCLVGVPDSAETR